NNPSVALRDNQQLALPANPDYFTPQQFTASARVMSTRTKVESCYYSFFWTRTCNEYDLFDAILSQAGLFTLERRSTNGQLYVTLSTQYGIGQYATGLVLPPNRSTHVSVSYDGVVLVVYIDGIERYREAVSGRLNDVDATNNDLRIGGWQRSRGQQTIRTCASIVNSCLQTYETGTTWQGYIDDVTLYGMALAPNDMALVAQNAFSSDNDLIVRPGESVIADSTLKNMLLGRVMQGDTTFQPTSTNYAFTSDDSLTYVLSRNASLRTSNVVTVPGSIDVNQEISTYRSGCAYASAVWCLALDESDSSIRAQTLRFADLSGNGYHLSCSAPNQCPTAVDNARMFTKELSQSHYQLQSAPAVGNS
ncbi:MAG: LamG-like jellyroll fold domain-containing protein, partial [Roseiflexaceae bacterium]